MNSNLLPAEVDERFGTTLEETPGKKKVNLVFFYENPDAAQHIQWVFEQLLEFSGQTVDYNVRLWKFSLSRLSELNRLAMEDACEADVIVIAADAQEQLSSQAETFLAGWSVRRRRATTGLLLLLHDAESGRTMECPAYRTVRAIARAAGSPLYVQAGESPAKGLSFISALASQTVGLQRSTHRLDFLYSEVKWQRWGINE
jgi:hypothetical protein